MGIRGPKNWVGEECIFLNDNQKAPYSAITRTRTKVLQISKSDLMRKLNYDYLKVLIHLIGSKKNGMLS